MPDRWCEACEIHQHFIQYCISMLSILLYIHMATIAFKNFVCLADPLVIMYSRVEYKEAFKILLTTNPLKWHQLKGRSVNISPQPESYNDMTEWSKVSKSKDEQHSDARKALRIKSLWIKFPDIQHYFFDTGITNDEHNRFDFKLSFSAFVETPSHSLFF